jgi:hypothetical protein
MNPGQNPACRVGAGVLNALSNTPAAHYSISYTIAEKTKHVPRYSIKPKMVRLGQIYKTTGPIVSAS